MKIAVAFPPRFRNREKSRLKEALQPACEIASTHKTGIILPMDWHEDYTD